ncbi:MAG: nucleotidyl transferase AbiEii/AbiGii toxin family protein [Verrucomicrobia bacterium]|nr:nucleotidyl transferase AbiEii/AbiGii toxin family protein [Verrucomicrobiota bacterium]MCH8514045.1 nucleotidyl transferase AbiEii/AbiGii toxin family protein [Kiritimatiellia bacterium]
MTSPKANLPASVRQRLLNRARENNLPFQELAQRYAIERFLSRLAQSPHADRFILKGAQMLLVWDSQSSRPTMDIDFLGRTTNTPDHIRTLFQEICALQPPIPDGIQFHPQTVTTLTIKEDADYEGVRATFQASLDTVKLRLQIDIGFNDIITPGPELVQYPGLLDFPAPTLRAYNRETLIAEKVEAMVKLGLLNSRMKDFHDIWTLSRSFPFTSRGLHQALAATFRQRQTEFPQLPSILTAAPADLADKQKQWLSFRRKSRLTQSPETFQTLTADLVTFLQPAMDPNSSPRTWAPPGPWA